MVLTLSRRSGPEPEDILCTANSCQDWDVWHQAHLFSGIGFWKSTKMGLYKTSMRGARTWLSTWRIRQAWER